MIDPGYNMMESRGPAFYLARLLGPKLAVLVVLLVLYLSIRHQVIAHLSASTVNLGIAHAEAYVKLALFGSADTITTFTGGSKTYHLTRQTIARADLFAECWRAVLWQIERGVIAAVMLVAAPPLVWFMGCTGWELWRKPEPEPAPIPPLGKAVMAGDLCAREVPPPPLNRFEPEPVEAVPEPAADSAAVTAEVAPVDVPVSPTAVPRKRTRKAKAPPEAGAQDAPPTPPLVQPGQVRKRPRPEA